MSQDNKARIDPLFRIVDNTEEFLEFLDSKGVCFWWQNPETKEVFDLSVGDSIFETMINEFRERKLDSS